MSPASMLAIARLVSAMTRCIWRMFELGFHGAAVHEDGGQDETTTPRMLLWRFAERELGSYAARCL